MKGLRVFGLSIMLVAILALSACTAGANGLQGAVRGDQAAAAGTAQPSSTAVAGMPTTAPVMATADTGSATALPALGADQATPGPGEATAMPPQGTEQVTPAPGEATAMPAPGAAAATPAGQASAAVAGDLQAQLEQLYNSASASVVNIQVTEGNLMMGPLGQATPSLPRLPGQPPTTPQTPNPHAPGGTIPLPLQAEGSGFVWDNQGNIVTNNHVVDGATRIEVTFPDGASAPATLVAADPDSDLAVIKVDTKGLTLKPVQVGDSRQVRPGQFVVAIGNPFGLQGTMTFGIVSAVGRSLPAGGTSSITAPSYTIPDIIQTDAPINPGNSGGVLLDLQGRLIGVPTAIDSTNRASAGVGFAVPSAIVQNVVPSLIQTGSVQHPYLGISGTTLSPDLAQAMNLPATQRGALVIEVTPGGPAAAGGVRGSTQQATVNGQQVPVGGDVIVKIDNQSVTNFDDIVSYLARNTKVGQTAVLTVLRNGQQTTVNVKLGNRPGAAARNQATPQATSQAPLQQFGTPAPTEAAPTAAAPTEAAPTEAPLQPLATPVPTEAAPTQVAPLGAAPTQGAPALATPQAGQGGGWLGVTVTDLTPDVAQTLNLPATQTGVLVVSVVANSPAAKAGLQGAANSSGTGQATGDVIVGIDGKNVQTVRDLTTAIGSAQPGQTVTLSVLRNGNQQDVKVTLGTRPAGS